MKLTAARLQTTSPAAFVQLLEADLAAYLAGRAPIRWRVHQSGQLGPRRTRARPRGWPVHLPRTAELCGSGVLLAAVTEDGEYSIHPQQCGRSPCPVCMRLHDRRRAGRVLDRVGGAPGLGAWVFTIPRSGPASWHQALTAPVCAWLRRLAVLVAMSIYDVRVGAVAVMHPTTDSCACTPRADPGPGGLTVEEQAAGLTWAEVRNARARSLRQFGRCPACDYKPKSGAHWEVLIPQLGLGPRGALKTLPRNRLASQLELARERWGLVLRAVAAQVGLVFPVEAGSPNCHYRWIPPQRVTHRLRYAVRVWAAWGGSRWRRALRLAYYGLLAPAAKGAGAYKAACAAKCSSGVGIRLFWARAVQIGPDEYDIEGLLGRAGSICGPRYAQNAGS